MPARPKSARLEPIYDTGSHWHLQLQLETSAEAFTPVPMAFSGSPNMRKSPQSGLRHRKLLCWPVQGNQKKKKPAAESKLQEKKLITHTTFHNVLSICPFHVLLAGIFSALGSMQSRSHWSLRWPLIKKCSPANLGMRSVQQILPTIDMVCIDAVCRVWSRTVDTLEPTILYCSLLYTHIYTVFLQCTSLNMDWIFPITINILKCTNTDHIRISKLFFRHHLPCSRSGLKLCDTSHVLTTDVCLTTCNVACCNQHVDARYI